MPDVKSILVRSGQRVELSEKSVSVLGGNLVNLRPRTPNALRTLLADPGNNPTRLHDAKSFERIKSQKGYLEFSPDKEGRFQGLSIRGLIAILRVLPPEGKLPKSVDIPVLKSDCGCRASSHAISSRMYGYALDRHGSATLAVPAWLRDLKIFRRAALFQDVVVEKGGLLTINYPTILARNFILHTGGRVKQVVSVVLDLSGSFRVGAAADA
jgi:hypothetical protein